LESRPQNARARKVPRSPSLSEEKAAVSVVQATSPSTSHKAVHFAFQDSEIPFIDALGFEFALEDQVINHALFDLQHSGRLFDCEYFISLDYGFCCFCCRGATPIGIEFRGKDVRYESMEFEIRSISGDASRRKHIK
jgi:hypothetical protein